MIFNAILRWIAKIGPSLGFACIALCAAWLADDAYIYLRVAENIAAGDGPVWNPGQRVQAFTGVIWTFMMAVVAKEFPSGAPGEFAVMGMSAATMALFGFLLSAAIRSSAPGQGGNMGGPGASSSAKNERIQAWIVISAAATLALSKSFRDWSSGGLETPLLFAALAGLVWALDKIDSASGKARWAACGAALSVLFLSRPDSVVLGAAILAPAMLLRRRPMEGLPWAAAGLAPLFAWEAFSLLYYGSWLPNTALSKMPQGYPRMDLVEKGWTLIAESASLDPAVVAIPIAAPLAAWIFGADKKSVAALAILPAAFAAAALWEGGDYMAGRLPAGLLVASVAVLARAAGKKISEPSEVPDVGAGAAKLGTTAGQDVKALLAFAAMLAVAALGVLAGAAEQKSRGGLAIYPSGIADEKAFYEKTTSWRAIAAGVEEEFSKGRGRAMKRAAEQAGAGGVTTASAIGAFGREVGRSIFVVDRIGLSDPFLARLPACPGARAGHYERPIPAGYVKSYIGEPLAMGPTLSRLLDDVRLATEAPLLAPGRAAAIFRLAFSKPPASDLWSELDSKDATENDLGERRSGACSFKGEPPTGSQNLYLGRLRVAGNPND